MKTVYFTVYDQFADDVQDTLCKYNAHGSYTNGRVQRPLYHACNMTDEALDLKNTITS